MTFLYPAFLFALSAIAIPIIIHLFNFRRYKKVYFSNVKVLKEVKERTQAQSQLKHLLVLLARIFAIACLVFAFAQPILKDGNAPIKSGKKAVSIYLDNSFSMNASGDNGNLFETARQYAYNISDAFSNADEIQIITNDFSAEQQRFYNKDGVTNLIDKIQVSANFKDLNQVFSRQNQLFSTSDAQQKEVYLITDAQENILKNLPENFDSTAQYYVVALKPEPNGNISIDSVWFPSPIRVLASNEELLVRLKNNSSADRNGIAIKLFIDDAVKSMANVDIAANSTTEVSLGFQVNQPGQINGRVEITDFPVVFDDVFYFQYLLKQQIKVLSIYAKDSAKTLSKLFKTDPYFNFNQADLGNLDYAEIAQNQLIILNEVSDAPTALIDELKKATQNGANVVLIPSLKKQDFVSTNQILAYFNFNGFEALNAQQLKVNSLNFEHWLFKDVFQSVDKNIDLPVTFKHFTLKNSMGYQTVMALENNKPFLVEIPQNSGSLFLFTSAPTDSASNFHKHALFVPTFFQLALQAGKPQPIYYTLGKQDYIDIENPKLGKDEVLHVINPSKNVDVIPEMKRNNTGLTLRLFNQITEAGQYQITQNNQVIQGVAFNYNRNESNMQYLNENQLLNKLQEAGIKKVEILQNELSTITNTITNKTNGTALWKYFLLAALVFFGVEMLLLRVLK